MRYVLVPAEKGIKSIEIDVPDEIVKHTKTKMKCKPIFEKNKCKKRLKSSPLIAAGSVQVRNGAARGGARGGSVRGGRRVRHSTKLLVE